MSTTSANKKFVFGDAGHCLAFGFGIGLVPRAPGTAGTLAAFPLYWGASFFAPRIQWAFFAALFAGGIWLCGRACKSLGRRDDGGVVLDEIAAFYAVLLLTPGEYIWQAAAFALFRFFDGLKPPPLNWLDANIGGGFGVMIDDIAAACFTVALLHFAMFAARYL
ncbi:MAG: phosphatidylglycerophosphatase A family protein [Gammaproteobacteria bacterium]